ncbi:MAG: hypothetical protein WCP08_07155 [Prolixibacteraceae bacterium]
MLTFWGWGGQIVAIAAISIFVPFRPILSFQVRSTSARGLGSPVIPQPPVETGGYKYFAATRLNPKTLEFPYFPQCMRLENSSTSAKRKTDSTFETKCCLSEAEGVVSSFCQVFFGYFL